MKKIIFSTLAIASMFSFISCERHTWEDSAEGEKDGTKRLFPKPEAKHEGHETHGAHEKKAAHGDAAHTEHGEAVKPQAHGEHGH